MHLKNPLLFGLMAILLLGGTITPVLSQTSPEQNILINEVETNPKGSDAGFGEGGSGINSKSADGSSGGMEFVELYNSGSQDVDIGGWSIVPSASWKTFTIPENTIISSNGFVIFSYVNYWFKDFGETISLDISPQQISEIVLKYANLKYYSSEIWIQKVNSCKDFSLNRFNIKNIASQFNDL